MKSGWTPNTGSAAWASPTRSTGRASRSSGVRPRSAQSRLKLRFPRLLGSRSQSLGRQDVTVTAASAGRRMGSAPGTAAAETMTAVPPNVTAPPTEMGRLAGQTGRRVISRVYFFRRVVRP